VLYWYPVYINNLPASVPGLVGVVLVSSLYKQLTSTVQHLLNQELVLVSYLFRLDTSTTPINQKLMLVSYLFRLDTSTTLTKPGTGHKSNQTKPSYLVSGSVAQEMDLIDGNQ
jgi:hypothetical protein